MPKLLKSFIWRVSKKILKKHTSDFSPANRSLPEADKWALSEFILDRIVPVVGVHPYPLDELLLMCATVAYFQPQIIIEWGTHVGASARVFYEVTHWLGLRTEIHSVDLPPVARHVENLDDLNDRGRLVRGLDVQLHMGDGLDVAQSIVSLHPNAMPLFFLDGDHAYQSVWRELNGVKSITPHAAVLVHDSFYQGPESNYNCGPSEAIALFAQANQLQVHSTLLGLPGMSLVFWNESL